MCNVSDVSYADVCDPERDRGRWRLALRQVRAALGCQPTGEVHDLCRVGRRFHRAKHPADGLRALCLDLARTRSEVDQAHTLDAVLVRMLRDPHADSRAPTFNQARLFVVPDPLGVRRS
jgi:hypothetical protein